eukprot:GFUD01018761.1.p1 GENE.GFUD01018761.1~~GFUD01018761.1.p1  ORF type:complete len:385 (+),score=132.03 GFUD01018761.1:120-1274(+)
MSSKGRTREVGEGQGGQSRALEGLPPKFVTAMRTLFDVLDDNKTGCVSLADIELWWRRDREEQGNCVPNGVIESLRKVATSDNLLTFERFCAGLKICLLRNQAEPRQDTSESNDCQSEPEEQSLRVAQLRKQRFISTPSPTLSLPPRLEHAQHGPPKPPRATVTLPEGARKLGDGGAASDGEIERVGISSNNRKQPKRRESHSRRHTLQNGIDYGLLKRMKAIEEERDGLMRGVQTVQRAEEWYQEQLHQVQDRMRSLGKAGGGQDNLGTTEAARERLLFQNARIHEVNQHLNCLMSSDMSFPLSMNLAVGAGGSMTNLRDPREMDRQITRLKEQNRMLTEEVSKKCTAITVLDQEKSALIRELFQARARARQAELNEAEATFM